MSVLRGLLEDLGAELQGEQIEFDRDAEVTHGKAAEVRMVFTLQVCVLLPPLCVRLFDTAGGPADDLFPWPHVLLELHQAS